MSLLAGACLAAASCSDSDKEIKAPSPNFPEAVSPTIGAGETFTIEIDPNQDWEASVPTATAAWFWIEDGTQKVWTLRGGAGPARIVIAAAELEEFDDNRVCEVTLTMGGQSKVIATITRGTLDRGFIKYVAGCGENATSGLQFNDSSTDFEYSEANLNLSSGEGLSSREAFLFDGIKIFALIRLDFARFASFQQF